MQEETIRAGRKLLENGAGSVEENVQTFLSRIGEQNPEINAFSQIADEKALLQAAAVDKKIKEGKAGRLAGAVIGIKEAIVQRGEKATASSRMLENFESVYDATAVRRLLDEDAVLIGRLNMDEFAMGSSTENSAFGNTKNPRDTSRVPGGSSGGSAAAVAAGMCHAALGSDTGGSIRQPASLCGVTGLKPTYGRVSRYGLIAYASSFDCIGPLTRDAGDAALMLEVLAGSDPSDATCSMRPAGNYTSELGASVEGLRIGIPEEYFGEGLESGTRSCVDQRIKELENAGAVLVPLKLPHTAYAIATYYILATAEASSNLARFDGIRFGHRADQEAVAAQLSEEKKQLKNSGGDPSTIDSPLIRLYKQSRTEGFGTEVKRRIMLGTYVLSAGYYDAYYGKAQRIRRLIQNDFLDAFSRCDVIVSPTSPDTAFKIGEKTDDPLQMYLSDIYTISANLAGIPAISVPAGNHPENGLPVGIQFMAPHFEEGRLIRAASAVENMVELQ